MRIKIKEIIRTFKQTGSVTVTASRLGISRPTVYRWLRRGKKLYGHGYMWRGVERHSTRPKQTRRKVTREVEKQVLESKVIFHWGAKKLKHSLRLPLSSRTIHRLLKTHGKVKSQTNYRRPLFQNGACMRPANTSDLGYLQMDTKHVTPELSGLPFTVYEYGAIDILSRYKVAVLLPDISDESAGLALGFFRKWFPFPIKYLQTDNGLEFQRAFELTCAKYHIDHYHIHKNSPNENAVIERSFRTDQEEFYFWLEKAPDHIGELNEWLQKFLLIYNTIRPHQGLDYKTPSEIVNLYLHKV